MDNETRNFYLALSDKAYEVIGAQDYERLFSPPEDKCPANLIHTWGVEMCRIGFDLAPAMIEGGVSFENKAT